MPFLGLPRAKIMLPKAPVLAPERHQDHRHCRTHPVRLEASRDTIPERTGALLKASADVSLSATDRQPVLPWHPQMTSQTATTVTTQHPSVQCQTKSSLQGFEWRAAMSLPIQVDFLHSRETIWKRVWFKPKFGEVK
jgi:hypothetical protein